MMAAQREDLANAEAEYCGWLKIGLSAGVALEKSAENYSLRKSDLKKYLNRHNEWH